jgi:HEAT repeat protein
LKSLIRRFAAEDERVLMLASAGIAACLKKLGPAELSTHIDFMRNSIRTVASVDKHKPTNNKVATTTTTSSEYLLPAFQVPKGIDPLVDVYIHALMVPNTSADLRESAASGLGEIIDLTSTDALKPSVVKIAGPLIRVVGDRFPASVKAAILESLRKLLNKGGVVLRPFIPQLQTTFVKAIQNPVESVRVQALEALRNLIPMSSRLDPLITELLVGMTQVAPGTPTSEAVDIRIDVVKALCIVLVGRYSSNSSTTSTTTTTSPVPTVGIGKILETNSPLLRGICDPENSTVRILSASVEGCALLESSPEVVNGFVQNRLNELNLASRASEPFIRHGAILELNAFLRAGHVFNTNTGVVVEGGGGITEGQMNMIIDTLIGGCSDHESYIRGTAVDAVRLILLQIIGGNNYSIFKPQQKAKLTSVLKDVMEKDESNKVRALAAASIGGGKNSSLSFGWNLLQNMEKDLNGVVGL